MPTNPPALSLHHVSRPPRVAPPPGTKPPLLLLLHGVGADEHDLLGLAPPLDGRFHVVSARAPLSHGAGFGWYPVQFTPTGIVPDETVAVQSRDTLAAFVPEAVAAYDLDPRRVFLAGFSQGAIMSLTLALHTPELVAGVAAMSGRLLDVAWDERASDERLSGFPILAVHGLYDTVLPIAEGRRIRNELTKLPLTFAYHEYPMAHEISQESLAEVAGFLTGRLNAGE